MLPSWFLPWPRLSLHHTCAQRETLLTAEACNKPDLLPLLCRYMFFLGLLMAQFTITGEVARPGFTCLGLVT